MVSAVQPQNLRRRTGLNCVRLLQTQGEIVFRRCMRRTHFVALWLREMVINYDLFMSGVEKMRLHNLDSSWWREMHTAPASHSHGLVIYDLFSPSPKSVEGWNEIFYVSDRYQQIDFHYKPTHCLRFFSFCRRCLFYGKDLEY